MKKFICFLVIFYLSAVRGSALEGKIVLERDQKILRKNEVFYITGTMKDMTQLYGFSVCIEYDESYLEPIKNHLELGEIFENKKVFVVSNHVGSGKVKLLGTLLGKENVMPKSGELFRLGLKVKKEGNTAIHIKDINILNRFGEKQEIMLEGLGITVDKPLQKDHDRDRINHNRKPAGFAEIELLHDSKNKYLIDRMDADAAQIEDLTQRSLIYKVIPMGSAMDERIKIQIKFPENIKNHHGLGIYQFDEDQGYWKYQGGEGDSINQVMIGEVNLLKKFALFEYRHYRSFNDITDPRIENQIKKMVMGGIVKGYEDNTFRPGKKVTREEFITLLLKVRRIPIQQAEEEWQMGGISDWARNIMYTAYKSGLVKGYADGTMGGNREITRIEAAVVLDNLLKAESEKEKAAIHITEQLPGWADESIKRMHAKGIMMADKLGNFYPHIKITRIEMIGILNKILDIGL